MQVGLGDKGPPSPGIPGVRKRVPGYSLLASSRVPEPQIPASLKVLRVPVTIIEEESLYSREPRFFLNGVQLYPAHYSMIIS